MDIFFFLLLETLESGTGCAVRFRGSTQTCTKPDFAALKPAYVPGAGMLCDNRSGINLKADLRQNNTGCCYKAGDRQGFRF
jgi:hypothetical protein